MNKLARLRKLTGDDDVVEQSNEFQWVVQPGFENMTASNMYTGESDSDEYAKIFNTNNQVQKPQTVPTKSKPRMSVPATTGMSKPGGQTVDVRRSDMYLDLKKYELQLGEFGPEDEEFCPWRAVKEYPWKFRNTNRSKVVEAFYSRDQYLGQTWDFFYVHRGSNDANEKPYLLVPTAQVVAFLDTINKTMDTQLTIPSGGSNAGFRLMFDNDGTPRPRYLGRSTNSEMVTNLHRNIPPSYYKLDGEPRAMGTPSSRSLAAFKAKIDMVQAMQRTQKARKSEKKKQERIEKQQDWGHSIKRVQRYLGLRQINKENHDEVIAALRASLESSNLPWSTIDEACNAAAAKLLASPPITFDPNVVAPYKPEGHVVFICVDVEAYERCADIITEIGIATLDTKDIEMITPGKGFQANTPAEFGKNWISKIRSRHFRIYENKHYNNSEFVSGCADKFEFGESEFISIKDAPRIVASCFKTPYSKPNATEADFLDDGCVKRPIILVGHDIGSDVRYLQKLGYDVSNLSNLLEVADTASMWRYLKREPNPRNLAAILAELGITGWNLHNAGNDATYTLQAMIGIAIQHILDKEKKREDREQEKKARILEAVKEAHEQALDKEEGWSSSGENTDGGVPVSPPPQPVNKNVFQSRISNAPAKPSPIKFDQPKTYFAPTSVSSTPVIRSPGWVAPHLRGIFPESEPIITEKPALAPITGSTAAPSPFVSLASLSKSQAVPTTKTKKYDFINFVPATSDTEATTASEQQTSHAQSTTSSISNPYENVDYDNDSVPGNFSKHETFRGPDNSSLLGNSPVLANPWSGVLVNSPVKPAFTNTFMNINTAMQGMGLGNPPVLDSNKENAGKSKEERKISPPNWSFTNSENKFGGWETQEEFNKLDRDLRAARKGP